MIAILACGPSSFPRLLLASTEGRGKKREKKNVSPRVLSPWEKKGAINGISPWAWPEGGGKKKRGGEGGGKTRESGRRGCADEHQANLRGENEIPNSMLCMGFREAVSGNGRGGEGKGEKNAASRRECQDGVKEGGKKRS